MSIGELLHPFLSGLAAFVCYVVAPVSCARSGCQWERLLHLRHLRYNACHVSCFLNLEPLSNSNLFFLIQWSFSLERMSRNTHLLSAWFKPWGKYSGCCSAVFVKQARAKCLDRTSKTKKNHLCSKWYLSFSLSKCSHTIWVWYTQFGLCFEWEYIYRERRLPAIVNSIIKTK